MKRGSKLYISGPMSNREDFNIPLFNEAARELRSMGMAPINPADLDSPEVKKQLAAHPEGDTPPGVWEECLIRDVAAMLTEDVDGIVLLPEWADSRGALLEVAAAVLRGINQFYIRMGEGHYTPVDMADLGFVYSIAFFNRCAPNYGEANNDATIH